MSRTDANSVIIRLQGGTWSGWPGFPGDWHSGGRNFLYCDGHAKWEKGGNLEFYRNFTVGST